MNKIKSDEVELRGKWIFSGSSIESDDVSLRIEKLVSEYLIEIAKDESGWEKLFQDPEDNRFWELNYPESELHGGGPPMLRNLSEFEAREKYTW